MAPACECRGLATSPDLLKQSGAISATCVMFNGGRSRPVAYVTLCEHLLCEDCVRQQEVQPCCACGEVVGPEHYRPLGAKEADDGAVADVA